MADDLAADDRAGAPERTRAGDPASCLQSSRALHQYLKRNGDATKKGARSKLLQPKRDDHFPGTVTVTANDRRGGF